VLVSVISSILAAQRLTPSQVQHRCDDLESLGYMLLYFLRGSLPWQGLTATDRTQKEELILEEKRRINAEDLCEGLPRQFAVYFDYIRSLDFDEKPKYAYLRRIFRDLFVREGFDYDHVYDWTILEYLMVIQRRKELQGEDALPEGGSQRSFSGFARQKGLTAT